MSMFTSYGSAYKYYDTPDGQDLLKKTWYLVRNAASVSVPYAFSDVMLITYPKSYLSAIDRFFRCAIPPIVAAVLYSASMYTITNVRKKDTPENVVLASILPCLYLTKKIKNGMIASAVLVPAVGFAMCYKDSKMAWGTLLNQDLYDMDTETEGCIYNYWNTWTLMDDGVKGWKKAPKTPLNTTQ